MHRSTNRLKGNVIILYIYGFINQRIVMSQITILLTPKILKYKTYQTCIYVLYITRRNNWLLISSFRSRYIEICISNTSWPMYVHTIHACACRENIPHAFSWQVRLGTTSWRTIFLHGRNIYRRCDIDSTTHIRKLITRKWIFHPRSFTGRFLRKIWQS